MITDHLTAPEWSSAPHPSPEAQLTDLSRLIRECRQHIDEAQSLLQRSDRILKASETCLKTSGR